MNLMHQSNNSKLLKMRYAWYGQLVLSAEADLGMLAGLLLSIEY